MKYSKIREEALKNKVAQDWFAHFDTTEIIGNIDFSVFSKQKELFPSVGGVSVGRGGYSMPLLWAEAKTGNYDIPTMFVQLILTIGKAQTFNKMLPPAFLGAFDFKKIAFVPYIAIQDIFYISDFDWTVTPSDHSTKEFNLIKERIEKTLKINTYIFDYEKDEKELKKFINNNIRKAKENSKIKITKNNFIPIYLRWLETIKPIIDIDNWDKLKQQGIIDADFYLADLFVDDRNSLDITDDKSIRDNLFVMYENGGYTIAKENVNALVDYIIRIKNKDTYQAFWKYYKRPPQKEWQEYIIERRDLIVPQDIRERKGAYFTPRQWVELSQKYISDHFGENWQDEYYIWDCAAGTGNLLAGLTNKYNIWASTLDQADVNVMHERISKGANLLDSHIFQFDFLNDYIPNVNSPSMNGDRPPRQTSSDTPPQEGNNHPAYGTPPKDGNCKLPQSLLEVLQDPEKRKKLIIYINPPYAEATNAKTAFGTGENKKGTSKNNYISIKYTNELGKSTNELFAQFLMRIYKEIPNSKIANFSTLKNLQSSNFKVFRQNFRAKLEKIFIVPANTFDNVKGKFPIGFFIWDCANPSLRLNRHYEQNEVERGNLLNKDYFVATAPRNDTGFNNDENPIFTEIQADIYDKKGNFLGLKNIYSYQNKNYINKWLRKFNSNTNNFIGKLSTRGNDFQNQNFIYLASDINNKTHDTKIEITKENLIPISIYFSVRHCIEADWLNDRDQFLYPQNGWQNDKEFQGDCLAFTLFHGQNRISTTPSANADTPSKKGNYSPPVEGGTACGGVVNHWLPFTEQEVDAKERFASHFMTNFIKDFLSGKNSPPVEGWQTKSDGVVYSPPLEGGTACGGVVNEQNLFSNLPPMEDNLLGNRATKNYMQLPYNSNLKDRTKALRKAGNLSEVLFWQQVKNKQFKGLDFDRQKIIGNYIVDFYCASHNVVIEIDGSSHDNKYEYDQARDEFLESLGLVVIHIADIDVKKKLAEVMEFLFNHSVFNSQPNSNLSQPPRPASQDTPPQEGNFSPEASYASSTKEGNFSPEAQAVFDAGRELWRYYHSQPPRPASQAPPPKEGSCYNVNASLYDIREHFQGRNEKGRMNSKSSDETYTKLIGNLREELKNLADKIKDKVYEYEFLKK